MLHLQIGDHQIDVLRGQHSQGLEAVIGAAAVVAVLFQDMLHIGAGDLFIVDDQDILLGLAAQGLGGQKLENPLLDLG